jgi:hypothetical protein
MSVAMSAAIAGKAARYMSVENGAKVPRRAKMIDSLKVEAPTPLAPAAGPFM